ncbi:MAG: hypothetical protein AAF581_18930 [Planctomycetota bacterium]
MKIRHVAATCVIASIAAVILHAWFLAKRVDRIYRAAGEEILLSLDGTVGTTGEFVIRYPNAHGCEVSNAVLAEAEPGSRVCARVEFGEQTLRLAFRAGERTHFHCSNGVPVRATVTADFASSMRFHNSVCGCETLGANIWLYGSLIVGVPIVLMSLLCFVPARP